MTLRDKGNNFADVVFKPEGQDIRAEVAESLGLKNAGATYQRAMTAIKKFMEHSHHADAIENGYVEKNIAWWENIYIFSGGQRVQN